MAWARTAVAAIAVVAVASLLVSGATPTDPRTPEGPAGEPEPLLGVALLGSGTTSAAVDSYGAVVDLRPAPAGPALLAVSAARQAAGSARPGEAILPRVRIDGGPALPLWRADAVHQRYLRDSSALLTSARFGRARVWVLLAAPSPSAAALRGRPSGAAGAWLACATGGAGRVSFSVPTPALRGAVRCDSPSARQAIVGGVAAERRWLSRARPLGDGAPAWAQRLYARSLLVLRGLSDRSRGAVAAGARDGWAHVWPRDAATAALALASAGYRRQARRIVAFLSRLDLGAAARFDGDGEPLPGRPAQGDAAGWLAVAAAAVEDGGRARRSLPRPAPSANGWRGRADYQEKSAGEYLGNALAAGSLAGRAGGRPEPPQWRDFESPAGLLRSPGTAELDSAAAWAVRPFEQPSLLAAARRTLRRLVGAGTRFGIVPSSNWPGVDPWTAPTAWSAWGLAALAKGRRGWDRREALRLLADLRRAATAASDLPERVDAHTGLPRSTTPLAWSHAFAVLALLELFPPAQPASRR